MAKNYIEYQRSGINKAKFEADIRFAVKKHPTLAGWASEITPELGTLDIWHGRSVTMRLNYYEFPEGVDPHTRYLNGASNKGGHCELGHTSCRECAGCWYECEHYHCDESDTLICGCSVTTAKKLLKAFGGRAWTEHCDRSGGCFAVTPIQLGKNNSRFKYNHHL